MSRGRVRLAAAALALALASGCHVEVPEPVYSPCAALASGDWSARIVEGPHPERRDRTVPMLAVSGTVTVPAAGYALSIEPGPLLDLKPPVQQVILRTDAPEDMAAQVLTEERVSGRMRYRTAVKAVSVRCGDGIIAEIDTIVDAR